MTKPRNEVETVDEAQEYHDNQMKVDPLHDICSCWCCCIDCDFNFAKITGGKDA